MAMVVGQHSSVGIILIVFLANFKCAVHADVFDAECQDHQLMITVPLVDANEPLFKAIDATGQFPISEDNGAQCGYTYTVYPMLALAILRASYFSCYTENKDDMTFTFNFHLLVIEDGEEVIHNITKTCSPSHPWSHREVACEGNYMEVSVQTDLVCPYTQFLKDVELASGLPKIMFQRQGEEPVLLSKHEAEDLGYFLDFTPGRIVFRTAYGQPHSTVGMVSGLSVEFIHPAVILQQRLTTMKVDLVTACTLSDGSYEDGSLIWRTPTVMAPLVSGHSGFTSKEVAIDVVGQHLDPQIKAEKGYSVDVGPEVVKISIPYGAEGGFRKSFVTNNAYHEFYKALLYYEHVFTMNNGTLETRLHHLKSLASPIVFHTPFTINLTVLEERVFTVYVGNFPFDVELVSVSLNGKVMAVPDVVQNGYQVSKEPHSNATHGYTISVPFEDPVVSKQYFVEGVREYSLSINYTLHILPHEDEYFYFTTVVAHILDVYPPYFNGLCMENGIKFRVDHSEFDYLWEPCIGPFPLTQKLADSRGYIMANDSQGLTLDVPLFTLGYIYEDVSLEQFLATFEIVIRDAMSLEVVQSSAKTCLFATSELLVCSPEGIMTVVSDLTKAIPNALPSKSTLLDKTCKPKEADEMRVLFEFSLNSCGTTVQVTNESVIYENEILFEQTFTPERKPVITRDSPYRVIVRCIYPAYASNALVLNQNFQSWTPGLGTVQIQEPLKHPVTVPPKVETTTKATTTQTFATRPPSIHRPAKYVRVSSWSSGAKRKKILQES